MNEPKSRGPDSPIGVKGTVVVVLKNEKTGKIRRYRTKNIVTNAGDLHYAERGAAETPTNFTSAAMEYGTAGNAPGKSSDRSDLTTKTSGSLKNIDGTYPMTNDSDGDNTGSGTDIVSWRVSYLTSEGNDTSIDRLILTNQSPGASEPVLMYALFAASFNKTASDTLKVFVNHTFTGS
jgi:hypothetical protein